MRALSFPKSSVRSQLTGDRRPANRERPKPLRIDCAIEVVLPLPSVVLTKILDYQAVCYQSDNFLDPDLVESGA